MSRASDEELQAIIEYIQANYPGVTGLCRHADVIAQIVYAMSAGEIPGSGVKILELSVTEERPMVVKVQLDISVEPMRG